MKQWIAAIAAFFVISITGIPAYSADSLEMVKKRGVLIAGVKDATPGFGFVDAKSREIVGYDVDFVKAIAKKLGVRLELKPVTSATRIPQLIERNIDIIAATMTKTPERARQIEFSSTYFFTGQKFIARKGAVRSLADLDGRIIGTARGSTSEQNAKKALPGATVLSFDDYPQALIALQQGRVFAVTTDESILASLLAEVPNKARYEIPDIQISDEPYGLGVRKGDRTFVNFVDKVLVEMEKNGEAKQIFEKYFGPDSQTPLKRNFRITAGK